MQVMSAESTELFVGPADAPVQLIRVTLDGADEPVDVRVAGDGLAGSATGRGAAEGPVVVERPVAGERGAVTVHAAGSSVEFEFVVAEPGWTLFMISHFHYDPVWWTTQGAYTSLWTEDPPGKARQTNAFELVHAHLEMAPPQPQNKFVLPEVEYLKPYWGTHPEDRADLRRLMKQG